MINLHESMGPGSAVRLASVARHVTDCLGGLVKKQNQSSEKEIPFFSEIITCNPSTYQMDHPDKTVSNFMEKSNGLQMVNKAYQ